MPVEVLRGGTANFGRVVRIDDTVRRPRGRWTPAVHDLLRHARSNGFAELPRVLALDDEHETLEFVDGVAAGEPMAPWASTPSAVREVGALLRRFHDSAADFPLVGRVWQRAVPEQWQEGLATHNDAHPANVIFRRGRPVSLIDFDLAAPGGRAWDLAVAACTWAPLRARRDVSDGRADLRLQRFAMLLDGYGADARLRQRTAEACADANTWIADIIQEASEAGHPAFGRLWEEQREVWARADGWIGRHRTDLEEAGRAG